MKDGQEWSKEQIDYLKAHYASDRAEDIGNVIGKSKSSVQHKANRLGLGKDREAFFEVRSKAMSGENCGNFKGYRRKTKKGYVMCYRPDHPNASSVGLVAEHRLIVERYLGSYLPKEFDVHHINGVKDDNRIENLAVVTHGAHSALHNREGKKQKSGKDHPLYKNVDKEAIFELREQGLTAKKICSIMGIGRHKYYKILRGA